MGRDIHEGRYFFKVYALDTTLNLKPGATASEVSGAMKASGDHVLAYGQIIGVYET